MSVPWWARRDERERSHAPPPYMPAGYEAPGAPPPGTPGRVGPPRSPETPWRPPLETTQPTVAPEARFQPTTTPPTARPPLEQFQPSTPWGVPLGMEDRVDEFGLPRVESPFEQRHPMDEEPAQLWTPDIGWQPSRLGQVLRSSVLPSMAMATQSLVDPHGFQRQVQETVMHAVAPELDPRRGWEPHRFTQDELRAVLDGRAPITAHSQEEEATIKTAMEQGELPYRPIVRDVPGMADWDLLQHEEIAHQAAAAMYDALPVYGMARGVGSLVRGYMEPATALSLWYATGGHKPFAFEKSISDGIALFYRGRAAQLRERAPGRAAMNERLASAADQGPQEFLLEMRDQEERHYWRLLARHHPKIDVTGRHRGYEGQTIRQWALSEYGDSPDVQRAAEHVGAMLYGTTEESAQAAVHRLMHGDSVVNVTRGHYVDLYQPSQDDYENLAQYIDAIEKWQGPEAAEKALQEVHDTGRIPHVRDQPLGEFAGYLLTPSVSKYVTGKAIKALFGKMFGYGREADTAMEVYTRKAASQHFDYYDVDLVQDPQSGIWAVTEKFREAAGAEMVEANRALVVMERGAGSNIAQHLGMELTNDAKAALWPQQAWPVASAALQLIDSPASAKHVLMSLGHNPGALGKALGRVPFSEGFEEIRPLFMHVADKVEAGNFKSLEMEDFSMSAFIQEFADSINDAAKELAGARKPEDVSKYEMIATNARRQLSKVVITGQPGYIIRRNVFNYVTALSEGVNVAQSMKWVWNYMDRIGMPAFRLQGDVFRGPYVEYHGAPRIPLYEHYVDWFQKTIFGTGRFGVEGHYAMTFSHFHDQYIDQFWGDKLELSPDVTDLLGPEYSSSVLAQLKQVRNLDELMAIPETLAKAKFTQLVNLDGLLDDPTDLPAWAQGQVLAGLEPVRRVSEIGPVLDGVGQAIRAHTARVWSQVPPDPLVENAALDAIQDMEEGQIEAAQLAQKLGVDDASAEQFGERLGQTMQRGATAQRAGETALVEAAIGHPQPEVARRAIVGTRTQILREHIEKRIAADELRNQAWEDVDRHPEEAGAIWLQYTTEITRLHTESQQRVQEILSEGARAVASAADGQPLPSALAEHSEAFDEVVDHYRALHREMLEQLERAEALGFPAEEFEDQLRRNRMAADMAAERVWEVVAQHPSQRGVDVLHEAQHDVDYMARAAAQTAADARARINELYALKRAGEIDAAAASKGISVEIGKIKEGWGEFWRGAIARFDHAAYRAAGGQELPLVEPVENAFERAGVSADDMAALEVADLQKVIRELDVLIGAEKLKTSEDALEMLVGAGFEMPDYEKPHDILQAAVEHPELDYRAREHALNALAIQLPEFERGEAQAVSTALGTGALDPVDAWLGLVRYKATGPLSWQVPERVLAVGDTVVPISQEGVMLSEPTAILAVGEHEGERFYQVEAGWYPESQVTVPPVEEEMEAMTGPRVGPEPPPDYVMTTDEYNDLTEYMDLEPEERGFYHVTTAQDTVLQEGLRPRAETGQVGLGGGVDDAVPDLVSVTTSEYQAAMIHQRLEMGVRAARGELTIDEILNEFELDWNWDLYQLDPIVIAQELDNVVGRPTDAENLVQAIKEGYTGEEYKLVQDLDDATMALFPGTWGTFEGPVRVGLTATAEQMARVDPDQIATLQLAVRPGTDVDRLIEERELRFKPEDVWVLDTDAEPPVPAEPVELEVPAEEPEFVLPDWVEEPADLGVPHDVVLPAYADDLARMMGIDPETATAEDWAAVAAEADRRGQGMLTQADETLREMRVEREAGREREPGWFMGEWREDLRRGAHGTKWMEQRGKDLDDEAFEAGVQTTDWMLQQLGLSEEEVERLSTSKQHALEQRGKLLREIVEGELLRTPSGAIRKIDDIPIERRRELLEAATQLERERAGDVLVGPMEFIGWQYMQIAEEAGMRAESAEVGAPLETRPPSFYTPAGFPTEEAPPEPAVPEEVPPEPAVPEEAPGTVQVPTGPAYEERRRLVERMQELGATPEEIADSLGMTQREVKDLLGEVPEVVAPEEPVEAFLQEMERWRTALQQRMWLQQNFEIDEFDPNPAGFTGRQADLAASIQEMLGNAEEPTLGRAVEVMESRQLAALEQLRERLPEEWHKIQAAAQQGVLPEGIEALEKYIQDTLVPWHMESHVFAAEGARLKADDIVTDYTRRYKGFDTTLQHMFPYHFWYTRQAKNWALRLMTQPNYLATYMRWREATEEHNQQRGYRRRFAGSVGIPAPWLPEWMGDEILIDPERYMFPFARLGYTDWYDLEESRHALDFMFRLTRNVGMRPYPYVEFPLMLSDMVGEGRSDIRAIAPQTRAIQGLTAMAREAGVGGMIPPGGVNIEAPIQRGLGLAEHERWDPYRAARAMDAIERMAEEPGGLPAVRAGELLKRVEEGSLTINEAMGMPGGIFTRKDPGVQVSPTVRGIAQELGWTDEQLLEAQQMLAAGWQQAGVESGVRGLGGFFGVPGRIYPEGERRAVEQQQRERSAAHSPLTGLGSRELLEQIREADPASLTGWIKSQFIPDLETEFSAQRPADVERRTRYYQIRDEIYEDYEKRINDVVRETPWDSRTVSHLRQERYQTLQEQRMEIFGPEDPSRVYLSSVYGATPAEAAGIRQTDLMYAISDAMPHTEDFVDEDGLVDYEAYEAAREMFLADLTMHMAGHPSVTAMAEELEDVNLVADMLDQIGLSELERHWRRNDTIMEAGQRVWAEQKYRKAWDKYHNALERGVEKGTAWEMYIEPLEEIPLTDLIPEVQREYGDRWTREELREAYEGVTFPPVARAWQLRMEPERRARSESSDAFWEFYNEELPPGRLTSAAREHPIVQLALDADLRGTATAEQYQMALEVLQNFKAQNYDTESWGTPEDWIKARELQSEFEAQAEERWPHIRELLDHYFSLGLLERREFRQMYPEIDAYWDMREEWGRQNPIFGYFYLGQDLQGVAGAPTTGTRTSGRRVASTGGAPRGARTFRSTGAATVGSWQDFMLVANPDAIRQLFARFRGQDADTSALQELHGQIGWGSLDEWVSWLLQLYRSQFQLTERTPSVEYAHWLPGVRGGF